MRGKYLSLFIPILLWGCATQNLRTGEYYATHKGWDYSIELRPDSTFEYIKRYEWPFEVSSGRWHVKNNELILNSIEDTFSQRKLTTSAYIMFVEKSYRIKRNKIVDDSSRLKYKLYGK